MLGNVREVGERAAEAATPVPAKLAVCGLPLALSVTISVALRAPVVVAVKVTLIVQLPPAATIEPQLFVCAKSALLVPVTAMPLIDNDAVPELDRVTA